MKKDSSNLIQIYSACSCLLQIKHKLFSQPLFPGLSSWSLSTEKRTCVTKVYICLHKLLMEFHSQVLSVSQIQLNSEHLELIEGIHFKLKNNKELFSIEDSALQDIDALLKDWNQCRDPLIYYDINERVKFKKILHEKLKLLEKTQDQCKEIKKPLYMRKIQRQLRSNLEIINETQNKNNIKYSQKIKSFSFYLFNFVRKIEDTVRKIEINSSIQFQKNELFREFVDLFQQNRKIQIKESDLLRYDKNLHLGLKKLWKYFDEQVELIEVLTNYLNKIEAQIKNHKAAVQKLQDQFLANILNIQESISHIVGFPALIILRNQIKIALNFATIFSDLTEKISQQKSLLKEIIFNLKEFSEKIDKKYLFRKENFIECFIEDKKIFQMLAKKQNIFQTQMYENLLHFFKKMQKHAHIPLKDYQEYLEEMSKQNINKLLNKFVFSEDQKFNNRGEKNVLNSSNILNNSIANCHKKIQQFENKINCVQIFDDKNAVETTSFQCALGPRLLIHGALKEYPEGIYYESLFNKRNVFFGRTKLFIAKQQIEEINKQSVLIIFSDVIQVLTKHGSIYFHALGKRQAMFQHLNSLYFPENNISNSNQEGSQNQFTPFLGNSENQRMKISLHMKPLENLIFKEKIANCNLRHFFKKYLGNQPFVYHGKTYEYFKMFTIELAEGTNVKKTTFSPQIPSYFRVGKKTELSQIEEPLESQICFSYSKAVPMIPFVSRGGEGICQQRIVYRWGGPSCLVVDIFSSLKGFSLTEGMEVRCRQVYKEDQSDLIIQASGEILFQTNSATNSLLRSPAFSNLKALIININEIIKKQEKNRKNYKNYKKHQQNSEELQESEVEVLQKQNLSLRKKVRWQLFAFLAIYLVTISLYFVFD